MTPRHLPQPSPVPASSSKGVRRRWVAAAFGLVLLLKLLPLPFLPSPWIIPDETDYAAGARSIWREARLLPTHRGGQPYPPGYPAA